VTRHFSYSSGSLSSMYCLILDLACCLRKYTSLLIIDISTCSTFAISDWLSPLLSSSKTLALRHSTCIFVLIYCISPCVFSSTLAFCTLKSVATATNNDNTILLLLPSRQLYAFQPYGFFTLILISRR
jgi:hypothetical protein